MITTIPKVLKSTLGVSLLAVIILSSCISKDSATNPVVPPQVKNHSAELLEQQVALEEESTQLSDKDIARYRSIFSAQEKGDWQEADALIAETENPILLGTIQAQRYLHKDYTSKPQELTTWLESYNTLPQAKNISILARKKGAQAVTPTVKKRNLKGYGESFRNMRSESSRIGGQWKSGLRYWNKKKYNKAYRIFSSLEAKTQSMGEWDRAAFSFWAYRTADKLGNTAKAVQHLGKAAQYPRSFYGAQAVHLMGNTLNESITLRGEKEFEDYVDNVDSEETKTALRRIEALLQIEQKTLARKEVILQYSRAEPEDRVAFVPLVQALNLPALQLRMGVDMERKGVTSGKALYPLPKWEPTDGFMVDPALVFAIARQESGFNANARSYAGARGTMQIMPQTAKYIAKKMGSGRPRLNDANANMDLGQSYLNYLAGKSYIDGNVVLIAAAYNAGPRNAKRWAERPSMITDPLYFIETISFSETRNYVMNVMTNYWMYREIISDDDPGVTLLPEGKWPMTQAHDDDMVTANIAGLIQPRS